MKLSTGMTTYPQEEMEIAVTYLGSSTLKMNKNLILKAKV